MAARPFLADTEDVLRSRIQRHDEQVVVEQDNARAQAVDYVGGVAPQRILAAGPVRAWIAVMRIVRGYGVIASGLRTLVCCT